MKRTLFVAILASLVGTLGGCPDRSIATVDTAQGRVEYKDIPQTINRKVDILFLVDNSNSMKDKQANLAANFHNFIDVLDLIQGGLPDVHIGVVDSDMGASTENGTATAVGTCAGSGDAGKLQARGTTGLHAGQVFISDGSGSGSGGRDRNYDGNLADVFGAMATGVGDNGCGFEQHLEAVKHALDPSSSAAATNVGFVREDAILAVIIIADEDDCSLADPQLLDSPDGSTQFGPLESFRCTRFGVTCDVGGTTPDEMNALGAKSMCHSNESGTELTKVQSYIDFLRGLKADPADVVVALIGGPDAPVVTVSGSPDSAHSNIPTLKHSCDYVDDNGSDEVADPSVRQSQFLNGFPNRASFTTICQKDLSDGLRQLAELVKEVIGTPCIDAELATPYDCSVSDVTDLDKSTQHETVLPQCTGVSSDHTTAANSPCWAIVPDATTCPTGSGSNGTVTNPENLSLIVIRGGTTVPDNDHVIANCVTTATADGDAGT